MCAQHAPDSAIYTSHPENCLNARIGEGSPFSYSVERRTPSDCRTENPSFDTPSAPKSVSTVTVRLPRSPKEKNISAGRALQKANGWRFSEILAHALRHDFRHLVRTQEISTHAVVRHAVRSLAAGQCGGAEIRTACGIDRGHTSDLERGKKSVCLPLLKVLSKGFGITVSELMRGV
jgi:hypothetical protein